MSASSNYFTTKIRECSSILEYLGFMSPTPILIPVTDKGATEKPYRKQGENNVAEDAAENEGWPISRCLDKGDESIATFPPLKPYKKKMNVLYLFTACRKKSSSEEKKSKICSFLSMSQVYLNKHINSINIAKETPKDIKNKNLSEAKFTIIIKNEGVTFYRPPYIS
ncbi:hypothetical protein [Halomonas binhaiensis]|uniref:Uncharacterized protein n=1 Tax=Halomonas binhaiensis TaxID=2562282 RepID=A0A5C1NFT0_9GAMM|nr:hypothetical protein [Halomonas binhaiensis]QEM81720.1 hypothetical protein E4T21_09295 [Halomonas binhaiensis]